MKRYTSTCILNHTITTRSTRRLVKWWDLHDHPEVEDVYYDEDGNVVYVKEFVR